MDQGVAIKTWLVVVVIAALHCPVSLTTRVSVAGSVNGLGDPADLHIDVTANGPLSGFDDVDASPVSSDAMSVPSKMFGPERSRDVAAGVAFTINGVAFTLDPAVARSLQADLFTNAGAEEDDLPLNGGGRSLGQPIQNVIKASANFDEHIKSIADSKLLAGNAPQSNEWDSRDFRPPEWLVKLREVVRDESPNRPVQPGSTMSHTDAVDTTAWLWQSVNVFMSIQSRLEEIDPITLVVIGMFIFPFALVGLAWKIRGLVAPSRRMRKRKTAISEISRPLKRVRVRTRRRRTRSLRVKIEPQN